MTLRDQRERERRFKAWTVSSRERLLASGIPLSAWSSARNWGYFLDHEELPYELEASGFSVQDLTPAQAQVLCELLQEEYGTTTPTPPLLATLRRRLDSSTSRAIGTKPWP